MKKFVKFLPIVVFLLLFLNFGVITKAETSATSVLNNSATAVKPKAITTNSDGIACPQVMKQCSDGSFVAGGGPGCEGQCPSGTKEIKTVATEDRGLAGSSSAIKKPRKDLLSEIKVRACEAKQSVISKRSEQIVKRTTNQQDLFSKLATNVENYYQATLLPQDKIVVNYDALVASISASQAAIAPLLAKAQADATTFSCDKDKPANQLKTFDTDMKAVIRALETYRKSVRNLIVAVRSVVGEENSATSSAKPITAQ